MSNDSTLVNIIKTTNVDNLIAEYSKALDSCSLTDKVLAVWDLDYTLVQPTNHIWHMPNILRYKDWFLHELNSLPAAQGELVLNLSIATSDLMLVDAKLQELIKKSSQKFPTIALTAQLACTQDTAPLPELANAHEWRWQQLNRLEIDFSLHLTEQTHYIFTNLPPIMGSHPTYDRGILYSNSEVHGTNKGKTLQEFLKLLHFNIDKIVMVDDRLPNLIDVQNHLAASYPKIKFHGICSAHAAYIATPIALKEDFAQSFQSFASLAKRS